MRCGESLWMDRSIGKQRQERAYIGSIIKIESKKKRILISVRAAAIKQKRSIWNAICAMPPIICFATSIYPHSKAYCTSGSKCTHSRIIKEMHKMNRRCIPVGGRCIVYCVLISCTKSFRSMIFYSTSSSSRCSPRAFVY